MKSNIKDLLIIQFAKLPVVGRVKTRLAVSIGNDQALNVHITLMNEVLNNLVSAKLDHANCDVEMWMDGLPETNQHMSKTLAAMSASYIECKTQKGVNLGDKMAYALISSLECYAKVLIVGSDCPNVTPETIFGASEALNKKDIVIVPAEDGGYVLIGASQFNANIFNDVDWGKGKVLEKTLKNINSLDMSYSLLEESWDVDDYADYERWRATKNKR